MIGTKQKGDVLDIFKALWHPPISFPDFYAHSAEAPRLFLLPGLPLPRTTEGSDGPADTPTAKYILGAIKNELRQGNLFTQQPAYKESLDCWTKKRQNGEACKVRQRGTAGQRKKCQTCLTDLPLEQMGV